MDLLFRYWNEKKMQVEVRYWDSSYMEYCTSHDLTNHFNVSITDLNHSKILQVSMDVPSVNSNFHSCSKQSWRARTTQAYWHWQLFPTHNHDAFKTGVESTDWEIKKTFTILLPEEVTISVSLKALYSHFHFSQPDGLRSKRWRKDWSVFGYPLSKFLITGKAFHKVNAHLAGLTNLLLMLLKTNFLVRDCNSLTILLACSNHFWSYIRHAPMLPYMNGDRLELIKSILRMLLNLKLSRHVPTLSKLIYSVKRFCWS